MNISGIYFIKYNEEILYIGMSNDLLTRYKTSVNQRINQIREITNSDTIQVSLMKVDNPLYVSIYEQYYITKYQPILNVVGKNSNINNLPELDVYDNITLNIKRTSVEDIDISDLIPDVIDDLF